MLEGRTPSPKHQKSQIYDTEGNPLVFRSNSSQDQDQDNSFV